MKTFEPHKTITELGIDTTRKFVVVNGNSINSIFKKGEILYLAEDDETSVPYFENEYGKQDWIYLDKLAYYEEEMKEGDWVYVSDLSEGYTLKYKRILLRKCNNGYVCVMDRWEAAYLSGDAFPTQIWKYAVPVPQNKTITFEVTPNGKSGEILFKDLAYNQKVGKMKND